jgi:hypothetical protein
VVRAVIRNHKTTEILDREAVPMRRTLVLLPAFALLAACDGDGGGTGSDPLRPEEVAGVYSLCTLRFQPSQTALPVADLLATVVDTTPPAGRPEATIALAPNGTYDLAYTAQQTSFLEQFRGSIHYRQDAVVLSVPLQEQASILLLPRSLTLNYNAGARRLTSDTRVPHAVARAEYARAAGISEEGLQNSINGTTAAVFSAGACP